VQRARSKEDYVPTIPETIEVYSIPRLLDESLLLVAAGGHHDHGVVAEWFLAVFAQELVFHAESIYMSIPGRAALGNSALPDFATSAFFLQAARRRALKHATALLDAGSRPACLKPEDPDATTYLRELSLQPGFVEAKSKISALSYLDAPKQLLRQVPAPFVWTTKRLT
jgi:hypothetical protein